MFKFKLICLKNDQKFNLLLKNQIKLKYINLIRGNEEIAFLLINAGAEINNTDIDNNTALHFATTKGHVNVVELLLKRPSIDIFKKN